MRVFAESRYDPTSGNDKICAIINDAEYNTEATRQTEEEKGPLIIGCVPIKILY